MSNNNGNSNKNIQSERKKANTRERKRKQTHNQLETLGILCVLNIFRFMAKYSSNRVQPFTISHSILLHLHLRHCLYIYGIGCEYFSSHTHTHTPKQMYHQTHGFVMLNSVVVLRCAYHQDRISYKISYYMRVVVYMSTNRKTIYILHLSFSSACCFFCHPRLENLF